MINIKIGKHHIYNSVRGSVNNSNVYVEKIEEFQQAYLLNLIYKAFKNFKNQETLSELLKEKSFVADYGLLIKSIYENGDIESFDFFWSNKDFREKLKNNHKETYRYFSVLSTKNKLNNF